MRVSLLLFFGGALAFAQAQQFEAASLKPSMRYVSRGRVIDGGPGTSDPTQITYHNLSLEHLIARAYDVRVYQLSAPSWMAEERFDIVAKVPAGATVEDVRVMLENLLAERFRLKLHREPRPTDVYALSIGEHGPKMKAYEAQLPAGIVEAASARYTLDKEGFAVVPDGYASGVMFSKDGDTRITITRQPIGKLCDFLSNVLQRPVIDQTGLTGRYDVRLSFANDQRPGPEGPVSHDGDRAPVVPVAPDPAPSVFGAVQKQLGLKLVLKKLPVELLVVDYAEKTPIEN